ncbi:LOW QUALITY PROTEIN: uncharacterized protein [Argopecten irradians]|uniref:LOW QUALITY PROTEIN: uncharacterized protein n=1 Tax=Argopecten irradians TaxID=31199 RepID=UPI003713F327
MADNQNILSDEESEADFSGEPEAHVAPPQGQRDELEIEESTRSTPNQNRLLPRPVGKKAINSRSITSHVDPPQHDLEMATMASELRALKMEEEKLKMRKEIAERIAGYQSHQLSLNETGDDHGHRPDGFHVVQPRAHSVKASHQVEGDTIHKNQGENDFVNIMRQLLFRDTQPSKKSSPYKITDFIWEDPTMKSENSDTITISTEGNVKVSKKVKPDIQNISVEQWGYGCIAILLHMLDSKEIDNAGMLDYLKYTQNTLRYFHRYQRVSVLAYDKEYREAQKKEGFKWSSSRRDIQDFQLFVFFEGPSCNNTPYRYSFHGFKKVDLGPGPVTDNTPGDIRGPLRIEEWSRLLDEDDFDRDYILEGVKHGFKLLESNLESISTVEADNYSSCTKYFDLVEKQIKHELLHGNYKVTASKPTIISALGAIPKSSSKVRLIHDASRPSKLSLNDHILSDCSCEYMDLREATKHITPGCYMAKVDLSNAYRSVPIHPSNYTATGLKWTFSGETQPTYMYDCRLPFGVSKSPQIFQRLSSAVCRILKSKYGFRVISYLDDFLIMEHSFDRCLQALNTLIRVLRKLGFSINWSKVEGPTTRILFLGIVIDSETMTFSLPQDKLNHFACLLQSYVSKKRASKKQLETLCGKLSWAAQVICGGRTFLRRIISMKNAMADTHHKALLSPGFFKDLEWWLSFLHFFNGTQQILNSKPVTSLQSDACDKGAGAYYNGDYYYVNWELDMPPIYREHINIKGLVAIYLAICRWCHLLKNQHVVIYTDNKTAASWINKGSSRNKLCMFILRILFWFCACYNFTLKCVYFPGVQNVIADTCSRLHENGKLSLLYQLLPSLQLDQFNVHELTTHMSQNFFINRWYVRDCAYGNSRATKKQGVG